MEKVLTLLVVHHIKLDGGKSFATFINDFYDPAIASALSNLNLKLLTFLESQPNFFHVDRQILPHILQLKSPPHLPFPPPPPPPPPPLALASTNLEAKCIRVIQIHEAKCLRRSSPLLVPQPIRWLATNVRNELHCLLRLRDFYLMDDELSAVDMNSDVWLQRATPQLQIFLQEPTQSATFSIKESNATVTLHSTHVCDAVAPENSKKKLLKSDEVGAFSVTAAKPAETMSKLLFRLHREEAGENSTENVVVDMTAGIGGLTIKLVKPRLFDRVFAFEIDSSRCELLRENVASATSQIQAKTEIVCGSSLTAFPLNHNFLPAAILDPPWGGVGYDPAALVTFAGLSLNEICAVMLNKCTVLGLKLPKHYNILKELDEDVKPRVLLMKIIGKQLFVIIRC